MSEFLNSIDLINFPKDQYINEVYDKSMIFLHHTAGSADPYGTADYWVRNSERVATAFIIGGTATSKSKWSDGKIVQLYGSAKAGWHLGLSQRDLDRGKPGNKTSTFLNFNSIGIEICNYGWLKPTEHGFKTYAGNVIPDSRVIELDNPYRGYKYWETYTEPQIESTRKLLKFLCDKYDITSKFKGMEMFEIDKRCLRGERGIWAHGSVRTDKWDVYPHPILIEMLKSL